MSSTRSLSPQAPGTGAAAVIVSHGQPGAPDPAEATLQRFAARVRAVLPGWHVGAATLAKDGALDAALAAAGPAPLVYPMFMTEGWFTGENLRGRLHEAPGAQLMRPLGVSPDLPPLAADLLRATLARRGWAGPETRLFIAGHGSGRSPNSARDTRAFAEALAGRMTFAEIRTGFVEERPYLAEVAAGLGPRAVCLPFFAAKGGHVTDDIPEALDQTGFEGVLLDPIGCAPGVPGLVARALETERTAA
ncbi:CbiX/SirB N-terminal domain-containing protein [Roseovarius salis]|uniref:CbiX/SirB N-terminal domain-containing protein n=1 Tax=Roseovarius salis TaxID=3376063 RepID=UPI0037C6C6FA